MAREILALTSNDIPELSRFLTSGFHAPPDADFAAPEVLRWKYLKPNETGTAASDDGGPVAPPCSYLARDETGQIIGHLGLCRTAFEGQALAAHGGQATTIHIIDWLGSPGHRAVGTSLMRKAHEGVATQFGLGVSPSALAVGERIGYEAAQSRTGICSCAPREVLDEGRRIKPCVAHAPIGPGCRQPCDWT